MRSLALFFALALLATPVLASDLLAFEEDDTCTRMAKTAGIDMEARQLGFPLSIALQRQAEVEAEFPDVSLALKYFYRKNIIEAYDTPRFQSKEDRKYAALEYRYKVHVACLKWMGG